MIDISHILIPIAHAAEEAANVEASTGVAGTLGLNLQYFIGQLLTFSVVLLILWKFVFTPVAKKLTERTEKIEKAMNDANSITKEKAEFEAWKNTQMSSARQTAAAIVAQAQNDANKVKDQTLIITKNDQEKLIAQAKAQIEQEKNQALQSAKSELADLVTNATEKILRHKLDANKDQELVKEMLKNI